ncbi:HRDC-like protein [Neohortaea acidophila]|uniref:HRDC-like protein n=1 Tax=Neohortaea acidophila TaxID=245834 RepID=A0A6A6PKD5_9PEZI|nr:HRDC-like protein [Neohortaea acidophila]KAF2480479.1 HRDC-like protein [Neohortaea acidophila]
MAGPPLPATLSRRRPPPTGDEETTTVLRLGEFEGVPCLSLSEAHTIIQKLKTSRSQTDEQGNKPVPMPNTDVYNKTEAYLETFVRFKTEQSASQVEAVSQKLVQEGLITSFERAQLATLCCDTVEEARTLIPSLEGKVSDDELQQTLDDISKMRDFS